MLLCSVLYPLVVIGHWADGVPRQGPGKPADRCARPSDWLTAHRPAVHGRRVFPTPAFGGILQRCRLRRFQLGGQQLLASRPRGTPAWPHREIRTAAPRRASRSLPTSKAGSRRTNSTGKPGIVAQWASLHSGVAGPWLHDWVKADKLNAAYVAVWEAANPDDVAKWKKREQTRPDPKPEDLAAGVAGGFFTRLLKRPSGHVSRASPSLKRMERRRRQIGPVKEGSDIQSLFFDHVAPGASRRGPGACPCRHGDVLRFGTRSATSRWTMPFGNWTIASLPLGQRRPETPTRKSCTTKSSSYCATRAMRRWAAWSACRW